MAQTLGTSGLFYDEHEDSPTFEGDITSATFKAVTRGLVNWTDINGLIAYLMKPTLVFGELFGVFAGSPFPDNSNLFCGRWQFSPADTITGASTGGVNTHNFAWLTITYQNIKAHPQNNTQDPVPMLTHEWDIGGEFVIPNNLALQWAGKAGDVSSAGSEVRAGIFVPTQEITINWPRIISPPFTTIRALVGKVNNADFVFNTGTMAFETGLFLGAKVRMDSLSDGTVAFSLGYKFSQKQVPAADVGFPQTVGGVNITQGLVGGWNHYFRSNASKPGFYRLQMTQTVAGSNSIYQHGDFTKLFQVDQAISEQGT